MISIAAYIFIPRRRRAEKKVGSGEKWKNCYFGADGVDDAGRRSVDPRNENHRIRKMTKRRIYAVVRAHEIANIFVDSYAVRIHTF